MNAPRTTRGVVSIAALLLLAFGRADAGDAPVTVVPARAIPAGSLRATGRAVAARTARVGSRVAGPISAWSNDETGRPIDAGSRVEAGQELFRVSPAVFEARAASAATAVAHARAEEADLRAGTRPERVAAAAAALAEVAARLEDLRRDEERYRRLVEQDKTVPARRLEEARVAVATALAQHDGAAARLAEAKAGPTATQIAVAAAAVAQAEASLALARVDVEDAVVRAPFSGVVSRRFRGLGDHVGEAPFVEVLELVSDRDLEVELRLPEARLSDVVPGATRVRMESPLLGEPAELPVARVVTLVEPGEGVFAFRVVIPEDRRRNLVPGAFVEARLLVPEATSGVVVPEGAVHGAGTEAHVFVARSGQMRKVPVALGDRLSDGVVVRQGLGPEDRVVVGPAEALKDGAPLPPPTSLSPRR